LQRSISKKKPHICERIKIIATHSQLQQSPAMSAAHRQVPSICSCRSDKPIEFETDAYAIVKLSDLMIAIDD
jgi:hypothetical protein